MLDDSNVDFITGRGQTRTRRRLASRADTLYFAIETSGLSAGNMKFDMAFRVLYEHV